jgi:exonuclease III
MRSRTLAIAGAACLSVAALSPGQTGTFIDRHWPAALRVVSYNVNWDSVFPDVDPQQADKFVRVVNVLQPDVLHLQEIKRSADDVAALLDGICPLPDGATWHAHKGRDSVIASIYPLSLQAVRPDPAGDRDCAMALVDLPDDWYAHGFYFMNNHYRCCEGNDSGRQRQSDALVNWMRDAREPGEHIDLPTDTAMAIVGDLNIVDSFQPIDTLITGKIMDNATYGADSPPDWDGSWGADAHPLHNAVGPDDYTWRDDRSEFDPGRLDFVIYTDSIAHVTHKFVLNTTLMSPDELDATGLLEYDVTMDQVGSLFDHLPLVVDFYIPGPCPGDLDYDGVRNVTDLCWFAMSYGAAEDGPAYNPAADVNRDGVVNVVDFAAFASVYGTICL